ncbi:MAG TPA: ATP-binding protein [Pseudomonas sp.]|uniref:ATP-binding protein n=1 Tax=Pseudomonas sp. TaxID=306 RepID=UPI002C9D6604|nr:ATP-binding protein [Pseudomonas sp.]HWH86320.1 ATP-binding protein [Pseudomonas sp.]
MTNIGHLATAVKVAMDRPQGVPGIVVMYGPSGIGKTNAGERVERQLKAFRVECKDIWTKKAFLQSILAEMNITPERTLSAMVAQIAQGLIGATKMKPRRAPVLILDDVQYVLDKAFANVLTDIYNASGQSTLVLIGEERVPNSLAKLERLHNRVLEWVPADDADLDDVKCLAAAHYPDLTLADDLLESLLDAVNFCLRRVVANLHRIQRVALNEGWTSVDLQLWGDNGWSTGTHPTLDRSRRK